VRADLRLRAAGLALILLAITATAAAQQAQSLSERAGEAYDGKRYAEAAELFVSAAASEAGAAGNHYDAACSYALAGNADAAFAQLGAAIDGGYAKGFEGDADLASLHGDPRWQPLVARFDGLHPDVKALAVLMDDSLPSAARYFTGRRAIAAGVSTKERKSLFSQYYAQVAQFVGEYDEASAIYGADAARDDPVGAGFRHAVDARPVVLARARGRQAVFLNESHGQSQTRAVNFGLLAGLRAEGFDVLALETLVADTAPAGSASHCKNVLVDTGLATRGYPIVTTGRPMHSSGNYTSDPVYAELVREALRLGFRLVAYDTWRADTQAEREQAQAEGLACVFEDDPKARMVVVAGFSHIAEGKDFTVPGGLMAYRFREASGIDPLTVDTTSHMSLDARTLDFSGEGARPPIAFALQNAAGESYGTANFDLALYVPVDAPDNRHVDKPSWLELGKRVRVAARARCQGKDPCLVEARRAGEDPLAVPSDRCVLSGKMDDCSLFLAPGSYEIASFDESGKEISRRTQDVVGR